MIIEDALLRIEGSSINRTAVGTVKLTPVDENDLCKIYRILSKGDLCSVDETRKVDYDVYVTDSEFDKYSLCIKGEVAPGSKSRVPAGSNRKIYVEKNMTLTLKKSKWDYFDLMFLDESRNVSIRPIVVVCLHAGLGEISLLGDGWTRKVTSVRSDDESKLFGRLSRDLVSKVNLHGVDHIFIASNGVIQRNFKQFIFHDGSDDKVKGGLLKSKLCTLEVPLVMENPGENLKFVLVHPSVTVQMRGERIKAVLEVESLRYFQETVREKPGSTTVNEDQIMVLGDQITTLLLSYELFRNGSRSKYVRLLDSLKLRSSAVIFFSEFNPWHSDLGESKVAAIFQVADPVEDE